jgi:ESS family glutamate:Na+ symporter
MHSLSLDENETLIVAVLAYFVGRWLTDRIGFLKTYSIPEPVTGGLVIAINLAVLHAIAEIEVAFVAGDTLLLAFFSTVGLNARLKDLAAGGRPLIILIGIAVLAITLQNVVGAIAAYGFGAEPALGLMAGSISLIGGHGTAGAWAPTFEQISPAAVTIGMTTATFGLVAGGLVGGPLARYLIVRHDLRPTAGQQFSLSLSYEEEATVKLDVPNILASLLVIAIAIALGEELNDLIALTGLNPPHLVTALFAGILIGNLGPPLLPRQQWPMRTPAMALIAELSLSLFLVRAMMSLQLWTLAGVAGSLLIVLLCQVAGMAILACFVVFRTMGRRYDAAVMSGGFLGLSLGATPTAVANMSALTDRFGPSPQAFIVVPLVGAFFVIW